MCACNVPVCVCPGLHVVLAAGLGARHLPVLARAQRHHAARHVLLVLLLLRAAVGHLRRVRGAGTAGCLASSSPPPKF